MQKIVIDGSLLSTREALHEYLADELSFPAHYGGNLDALFDCLTEVEHPVEFVMEAPELLVENLGQYAVNLALVLHDAQSANPNIIFDFSFDEADL